MWKSYTVKELITIPRFYTFFKRHRKNGYSFEGETHNFWECLYIIDGSLRVTADDRIYILNCGNIVFHKPLELHKYDVLSEEGADILVFSFDLEGQICDFLEGKVIDLNLSQIEIVSEISKHIDDLIKNNELYKNKEKHTIEFLYNSPVLMQLIVEYIKILFIQIYFKHQTANIYKNKDSLIFKDLVCYMKENIEGKFTTKDLSDKFYISESTIKRIFKKNAGMGIHAYFLKLKIAESVKRLKAGVSVNETALELGFNDASYFTTAFKRETGMSPTKYLQSIV